MNGRRASASQRMGENPRAPRAQHMGKNLWTEQTQRTGGTLMAVRTQQMGFNSRTEVTRSYTLTSREARARAGSTHPNQDERSSLMSFFRILGHEADLRDTLNRRRDRERSQQSTTQNKQPILAPRGKGEISVEDLYRALAAMKENDVELIVAAIGSSFNQEVREARLPKGFKLSTIKAYDGKSDPQDHLNHLNDLINLHLVSELAMYRVLAVILAGGAKKWFRSIPIRSVFSWQQLSTSFLQHFQVMRKTAIPLAHQGNVK